VTVDYPNGEEELCEGESETITWESEQCCGSAVEIALLRQGTVVDVIAESTTNDGAYDDWTPERFNSSSVGYQIRITDLQTEAEDLSDAMFRINSDCYIEATAPAGGTYYAGSPMPIEWDTSPCCGGSVRIALLLNHEDCLTIVASTPNDGSYVWTDVDQCDFQMAPYTVRISHLTFLDIVSETQSSFLIYPIQN